MSFTQWMKERVFALGFDDVRVASAREGTPYQSEFLDAIFEGRHGPLDYLERSAAERSDVLTLMPDAKSVVVVAKNYYSGEHGPHDPKSAKISRYAWGGDYHHWFKKRLRQLRSSLLQKIDAHAQIHIFNDTGPVLERGWAERAGLGFIGKSGMLIHQRYGTWTFLGGFVTDIEFAPDKPLPRQMCGTCTACMDACPTQAIVAPRKVDARRCLTTWNVERPHHIQAEESHLLGHGWALGCDICQEVCPWNKFQQITNETRFHARSGQKEISEDKIPAQLAGTALARPGILGLNANLRRSLSPKLSQNASDPKSE